MKKLLPTTFRKPLALSALTLAVASVSAPSYAELSGNVSVTNNYIWRGLTQSINEAAVQGGIDYASDTGLYIGTWVSNVAYDSDDAYSYEHDIYFGYAGEIDSFSYDLGYLYYNYDENAGYDFGEIYGSVGFGGLGLTLYLLTNAEPDEAPGEDFGFAEASYFSVDYAIPLTSGTEVGLHAGFHEGDFAYSFNGVTEDYMDFNISIAKDGFGAMISFTDLDSDGDGDGLEDYANMPARDNDEVKFVISYGIDFTL